MTIRCKHCQTQISLTERESAQIAADLDRRFSWAQQANLAFEAVCADCWTIEERRMKQAQSAGRRVQFVSATV